MRMTELSIPKMDCPTEEQLIRLKLSEVVGVQSIKFDLGQRTIKVVHTGSPEKITAALEELSFLARIEQSVDVSSEELAKNPESEAKILKTLLAINGLMFFIEMVGGLIGDSVGIMADSVDMLADALVYSISLYAVGKSVAHQKRAARISGYFQGFLALGIAFEAIRRFFFEPNPNIVLMSSISLLALTANTLCIILLNKHRSNGSHMRASWIFSVNDILANIGVIVAAGLIYVFNSPIPDLIIGIGISIIVFRGSQKILSLAR